MDMSACDKLVANLRLNFASTLNITVDYNEITLQLSVDELISYCKILRDNSEFKFDLLLDICGVDYLLYGVDEWNTQSSTSKGFSRAVSDINIAPAVKMPERFAVVYHLLSTQLNHRIRLKVFIPGDPPHIPSVLDIWKSANWYEREAFDLFGIIFDGHPDLRRILTDYGFIGHPFRKDFPLIGQVEMRYDALAAKVIYEPVSIEPRVLVPKVIRQVGYNENG